VCVRECASLFIRECGYLARDLVLSQRERNGAHVHAIDICRNTLTHTHVCVRECASQSMREFGLYIYVYIYIIYTYVYIHICTHVYIYMYIHMNMCTLSFSRAWALLLSLCERATGRESATYAERER